jgi:large subunit ribosomal protein L18
MKLPRKRRLQGKTDYKARLSLLKSGKPRLVIRKTNKYITAQFVESDIAQDKVLLGVNSKSLISKGWPKEKSGSLKNSQAAYLTGLLLGSNAKEKGISEAILDLGLNRSVHKSRLYAVLKGIIDAGIKIPHDEKALPKDIKQTPEFVSTVKSIKQ